MKKFLLFVLTLFAIAGCGNKDTTDKTAVVQQPDSGCVRIAVQPTFESLPLLLAEENGMFDKCGVKVNLKMFYSQADCDTAMLGNSADAMITDIVRGTFWEQEHKQKLDYVTWTNTRFMLVSSKKARIKDLSQMTDRLMAVTRNSFSDVLADSAMIKAGKTPEEMFKVQINNQEIRLNMLLENKMDAAFLQHPYAAEAVAKGGTVLMSGGNNKAGVVAFKKTADKEKVKKILAAYDMACDSLNVKGVMHYAPLVMKYMRKDISKWARQIGDFKFNHSQKVDEKAAVKAESWLREN